MGSTSTVTARATACQLGDNSTTAQRRIVVRPPLGDFCPVAAWPHRHPIATARPSHPLCLFVPSGISFPISNHINSHANQVSFCFKEWSERVHLPFLPYPCPCPALTIPLPIANFVNSGANQARLNSPKRVHLPSPSAFQSAAFSLLSKLVYRRLLPSSCTHDSVTHS